MIADWHTYEHLNLIFEFMDVEVDSNESDIKFIGCHQSHGRNYGRSY